MTFKNGQWNLIRIPKRNPYVYDQLISMRVPRKIDEQIKCIYSINDGETAGYPHIKECLQIYHI